LFLGTGIRISELVGIDMNDLDMDVNGFKITRKGGNQTILYFSDEVRQALDDYIDERAQNPLLDNEPALFVSLQNKRITVRAVEKLVKKYASITSPLKHITPHKLRSTYGTNLYKETNDIYVVAEVLGHKDINTTKKHYAAISDDIKRAAANKVSLRHKDEEQQ
jgi:site-specific recombinase XerD